MSNSYINDSLASIAQSSSIIRSLTFHQTQVFTLAVLSPESWFETHLIRDAEPHELALFRPSDNRYDPIHAQEEEKWVATKRKGPERLGALEKASPLKESSVGRKIGADDPERCIIAAQKLLEIYPMPRAQEHVEALMTQFEGLKSSIADLEDQMKRPLPKPIVNTAQDDNIRRASELADAIRREEMEIFALEQIMAEKELERIPVTKPKVVKPTPSTASGSNPFAKSNVLDRKVLPKSTPPASPITSPRRVSSTTTPARSSGTPKVSSIRTKESPAPSPEKVRTPVKVKAVVAPTELVEEITPRASRIAARSAAPGGNIESGKRNNGVSDADLEMIAAKVWNGMGDALRPWARKTLIRDGEEIPSPLKELPFKPTLTTLATILSSTSDSNLPVSPGGSIASTFHSLATTATGTTEDEDSDPSPPQPSDLLEFELLNLLLSTLSSTKPIPSSISRPTTISSSLPTLSITFRDAILVSSLASSPTSSPNRTHINPKKQDPMVSMNALKTYLGTYANERGWEEVGTTAAMGTTAIYSLVSKAILRIDRRGKEGPMIGFRN